jgi:hypothetical protein
MISRIMQVMGGLREEETRRHSMEQFIVALAFTSVIVAPVLILCYMWTAYKIYAAKGED